MPTFTNRFFQTLGAVTYPAFYIMRNNDWWRQNEVNDASQIVQVRPTTTG
eukprot:jgi/Psemu1/18744/gm1.18744_g